MAHRFADRNDPKSLQPKISEERADAMWEVFKGNPGFKQNIANDHALRNDKTFSPFVSVSRDPEAFVQTSDWTVRSDVIEQAPDIGHLRVPANRLVTPTNKLSGRETEALFDGHDLGSFNVGWTANPYRRG